MYIARVQRDSGRVGKDLSKAYYSYDVVYSFSSSAAGLERVEAGVEPRCLCISASIRFANNSPMNLSRLSIPSKPKIHERPVILLTSSERQQT
jgi:hypothetical protein